MYPQRPDPYFEINPNRTSKVTRKIRINETHTYRIQSYQRLGASSPGPRLRQQHPYRERAEYADRGGLYDHHAPGRRPAAEAASPSARAAGPDYEERPDLLRLSRCCE